MGNDKVEGRMLLATSHDSSMQTIGRATQVRVVCMNTMRAALRDHVGKSTEFKMSHLRKWTPAVAEEARLCMGMAQQQLARTNEVAEALAGITISSNDWLDFMGKLMGDENVLDTKKQALSRTAQAIKDATIDSPGSDLKSAKGTLWGAVNGVTYFADHQRGRTDDSRLTAAWFGEGDRLKSDAMAVAVEMAGVKF
jgi:phage/plasmid-like protein (TIGR03299 family)